MILRENQAKLFSSRWHEHTAVKALQIVVGARLPPGWQIFQVDVKPQTASWDFARDQTFVDGGWSLKIDHSFGSVLSFPASAHRCSHWSSSVFISLIRRPTNPSIEDLGPNINLSVTVTGPQRYPDGMADGLGRTCILCYLLALSRLLGTARPASRVSERGVTYPMQASVEPAAFGLSVRFMVPISKVCYNGMDLLEV